MMLDTNHIVKQFMLRERSGKPRRGLAKCRSTPFCIRQPASRPDKTSESPTHKYVRRADLIARSVLRRRHRRAPSSDAGRSVLSRNERATPQLCPAVRLSRAGSTLDPDPEKEQDAIVRLCPNMFVAIRLPHPQFSRAAVTKTKVSCYDSVRPRTRPAGCDYGCTNRSIPAAKIVISAQAPPQAVELTRALQDLVRVARGRAEDVLTLRGLLLLPENALRVPPQLAEDTMSRVEFRENIRLSMEGTRTSAVLAAISGKPEDKDLRRYVPTSNRIECLSQR